MLRIAMALLVAFAANSAQAAGTSFDPQKLLFGIGVSRNDVSGSNDGTGVQMFGAYPLGEVAKNIHMDVEVGYMDTGNMDLAAGVPPPFGTRRDVRAKGFWANGVARVALSPQAEFLARAGFDFGDDDGLMAGVGIGLTLSKQWQMRVELVERDNVDSLQLNFVLKP